VPVFTVILLALAVSIDGLGVGIACGLGKVKLPVLSLFLMGVASGSAVLISMTAGKLVSVLLNSSFTVWLGGLLLVGLGLWMLWQLRGAKSRVGLLGLLDNPSRADSDQSGSISAKEALVLGIALALDAFSAGFGAALAGFPPLITGLTVAVAQVVLVALGSELGDLASGTKWIKHINVFPGLIICILGLLKIFLL